MEQQDFEPVPGKQTGAYISSDVPEHIQGHVETIATHEQQFLARRTTLEKLGDSIAAFAGSLTFVTLHLCFFAAWFLVNSANLGAIPHFDPYPFSMLGTFVAIEGILLASFILIGQPGAARRSDERDHLILQILILSEREITATLKIQRELAARLGLHHVASDREAEALSQPTSIDDVAQSIRDNLPQE